MTWWERAACGPADMENMFRTGDGQSAGKHVCTPCPVRLECLAFALDQRIEHGIWGGMTGRERRALRRRRPAVASWRRLLEVGRVQR
ncbi:WhiB family transcriptional regulator [Streptomyces sp. GLT-R25]